MDKFSSEHLVNIFALEPGRSKKPFHGNHSLKESNYKHFFPKA